MTTLREAAQQALEALKSVQDHRPNDETNNAITNLRAALAQQAEPVEPVAWMVYTLDGKSVCVTDNPADFSEGHRALPLYTAPPRQTDPQIEDRLARHGINPCPDCRGIGYDASGQLCWCQQNPSF
jgi:hypothetical protein